MITMIKIEIGVSAWNITGKGFSTIGYLVCRKDNPEIYEERIK